jgi:hypothetical protein
MARPHKGRFLGIPYNFAPLRRRDIGRGLWDPADDRIFPPKNYGYGWGFNTAALVRRLRARSGR